MTDKKAPAAADSVPSWELEDNPSTLIGGWGQAGASEDRREHPRFAFQARVSLIPSAGEPQLCNACDLSLSGILLRAEDGTPLPIDQFVEVALVAAGVDLSLSAIVVRHAEDGAFGVRFIDLEPAQRAQLGLIVDDAERSASDEFEKLPGTYAGKR